MVVVLLDELQAVVVEVVFLLNNSRTDLPDEPLAEASAASVEACDMA